MIPGVNCTMVGRLAGRIDRSVESLVSSSPSSTTTAGSCVSLMSTLLRCDDRRFGMAATTTNSRARMSSRTSANGRLLQQKPYLAGILAVRVTDQIKIAHRPTASVECQHCADAIIDRNSQRVKFGDAGKGARL